MTPSTTYKSPPFPYPTSTGKELDEETGYGYFGARYMDHELMTGWLSVDPMADKYPNLSPYNYCAWNPVRLVDPDGNEIHIVGDGQYRTNVVSLLNELTKSGLAGKFLVYKALKSKKTFAFIQPSENDNHSQNIINTNGRNGDINALIFDANQSGIYDDANGGVTYNALTTMAHELAHFVFPNNHFLVDENGYRSIRAGEVKAVEWENMVRADKGMDLRKRYGGVEVFGKTITPHEKYTNDFNLSTNNNYMRQPQNVGSFKSPGKRMNTVYNYLSAGGSIVLPPNCKEYRYKL